MANRQYALSRVANSALGLALSVLVLPLCAASAPRDIAIVSYVHCEAYNGKKPDPAWTQQVNFFNSAGTLHAI